MNISKSNPKSMTDKEKVETLCKANPKLSERDACLLLGIDPKKLVDDIPEFFKGIFE